MTTLSFDKDDAEAAHLSTQLLNRMSTHAWIMSDDDTKLMMIQSALFEFATGAIQRFVLAQAAALDDAYQNPTLLQAAATAALTKTTTES